MGRELEVCEGRCEGAEEGDDLDYVIGWNAVGYAVGRSKNEGVEGSEARRSGKTPSAAGTPRDEFIEGHVDRLVDISCYLKAFEVCEFHEEGGDGAEVDRGCGEREAAKTTPERRRERGGSADCVREDRSSDM